MMMNKKIKIHKRSNNRMRILNKNKFKIIFLSLNRKNIKNTWISFIKMKRKTRQMPIN